MIIDNLRSKYLENIEEKNKEKFKSNLDIIVNQIKQIENLVNEFSDFARMPKPLLKKNSINQVILNNIKLLNKSDTNTRIVFNNNNKSEIYFNFDQEQINRAIFNFMSKLSGYTVPCFMSF